MESGKAARIRRGIERQATREGERKSGEGDEIKQTETIPGRVLGMEREKIDGRERENAITDPIPTGKDTETR